MKINKCINKLNENHYYNNCAKIRLKKNEFQKNLYINKNLLIKLKKYFFKTHKY